MKEYCTQNNGDCETCSLVNYGLDCKNNPVGRGGPNRNQGRKKTGADRGGLVPVYLKIFADQAERLKEEGQQSLLVRMALDNLFDVMDKQNKKSRSG